MPLVAPACLAYALGLLTALWLPTREVVLAAALLLVGGAGVLLRPSRRLAAPAALCLLLGAAGLMVGSSSMRARAGCAQALSGARPLHVRLDGDAAAGALVRGTARAAGCSLPATMLVTAGTARAGDEVAARGLVSVSDRGLLIRDGQITVTDGGAGLAGMRAQVGRRIDRIFAADAPLVRALVIADMSAIPAEQRDRFAKAGLVHMLSVSGLHVAIVALALELLAVALRIPRPIASIGTVALLGAYVLLIGAPPPAVRAALMLALFMVSRLVQRPTSRWAVVAVGSAAPLVDPQVVLDLGWQLSVAGTVALVAGGALARRTVPRPWRGARRGLATAAIVSVVATLVTAPLVAWTFGRLAILGPLTNLLADPVMGLLQPLLFLALCMPVVPAQHLLADASHLLIVVFDAIATHAAALPFAAPVVLPTAAGAVLGALAAVALVCACTMREWVRPATVALASVSMMVAEPLLHFPHARTELHMIDVGQGDAVAIRTRAGRWVVVDAGRSWIGGDAGRSTVVPYITHRGGSVALFVMSHPHADHVGGAASLLDALHPALFLDPGYAGGSPPYLAALASARRDGVPWRRVHPGDSLAVDEVTVTALAPDSAWASRLADANLASAVVMLRVGAVRMLLTGDAEGPEEDWLLSHAPEALGADVLKVGHHGSSTSTTPAFLAAVRPRVALVSVGAGNSYGHPSGEVMDELASAGAEVLRTDRVGTIVIRTDGQALEVEARGVRWEVPSRPVR